MPQGIAPTKSKVHQSKKKLEEKRKKGQVVPENFYKSSQVKVPTWKDTAASCAKSTSNFVFSCLSPIENFLEKRFNLRKFYAILSIVFLAIASVFFLIGITGPTSTEVSTQNTIENRFYRGDVPTADALKKTDKLEVDVEYKLVSIENLDDVLNGAKPIPKVLDGITFTETSNFEEVKVNKVDDIVEFKTRMTARKHNNERLVKSGEYTNRRMTIPNLAFREMQGIMQRNEEVLQFEDAAVPMFAAKALKEFQTEGPIFIKRFIGTFAMERMLEDIEDEYGRDRNEMIERWRKADTKVAEKTRFMVLAPSTREIVRDNPIHINVANIIWNPAARISCFSFEGWGRIVEAALAWSEANSLNVPEVQTYYRNQWEPLIRTNDPRWGNEVTGSVAAAQLEQFIKWVYAFLKVGQPVTAGQAHEMEVKIAELLYEEQYTVEGRTYRLIDQNEWSHVLPAQLGNGAVSGFVYFKLEEGKDDATINELLETAGMTARNECPGFLAGRSWGGSLVDNPFLHSRAIQGIPNNDLSVMPQEASCAFSRYQSGDPSADSDTTPLSNFESKFNSTQMKFILETFTSGEPLSHAPLQAEGAERISRVFWGSQEMRGGRIDLISDFWATARTLNVSIRRSDPYIKLEDALIRKRNMTHWIRRTGSSTERSRFIAKKEEAIMDYNSAVLQFSADQTNEACAEFGRWNGPQLDESEKINFRSVKIHCLQILDLAWWFDILAREYIFNRRFVFRASLSKSTVVSPTVRFSGPFLETTPRTFLEVGLTDNLYEFLFNKKYPPLGPPDNDDVEAWKRGDGRKQGKDVVALGLEDPSLRDKLTRRDGKSELNLWDQLSPVSGSHTRFQISPRLNRNLQTSEPPQFIDVWEKTLERTARFDFSRTVTGPGDMSLWRYKLTSMDEGFPSFESDKVDKFDCTRSLHTLRTNADNKRSNTLLKISQPYLYRCGAQALLRDYDWSGQEKPDPEQMDSYLDIDPRFGQAIEGRFRYAKYLFWSPSRWFATLVPALGMLYIREEKRQISEDDASSWKSYIDWQNNLIDNLLPGMGFGVAFISFFIALLLALLFHRRKQLHLQRKNAARMKLARPENLDETERERFEKMKKAACKTLPECKSRQQLIRSKFEDEPFQKQLEDQQKAVEYVAAVEKEQAEKKEGNGEDDAQKDPTNVHDPQAEAKKASERRAAIRQKKKKKLQERLAKLKMEEQEAENINEEAVNDEQKQQRPNTASSPTNSKDEAANKSTYKVAPQWGESSSSDEE